jgi:hypothetical protein
MVTIPRLGAVLVGGRLALAIVEAGRFDRAASSRPGCRDVLASVSAGADPSAAGLPLWREALVAADCLVVGDGPTADAALAVTLLARAGGRTPTFGAVGLRRLAEAALVRPSPRSPSSDTRPVPGRDDPASAANRQDFR